MKVKSCFYIFVSACLVIKGEAAQLNITNTQLHQYKQPYTQAAESAIKRQRQLEFVQRILQKKTTQKQQRLVTAEFAKLSNLYRAHLRSAKLAFNQQSEANKKQTEKLYKEAMITLNELQSKQTNNQLCKAQECHRLISAIEAILHGNQASPKNLKAFDLPSEPQRHSDVLRPLKGESLPIKPHRKPDLNEPVQLQAPQVAIPDVLVRHKASSSLIEQDD